MESLSVLRYIWQHPANCRRRVRAVIDASAFQLRGRLLHRSTIFCRGGVRMKAELHFTSSSKALYSWPPDWNEMTAWARLLQPGDLFVDVGANVGVYSLWAAERGATVIAVEPDAAAADRLESNALLSGFDIEIIRAALDSKPGLAHLTSGLDSVNHLIERATFGSREIVTITLDELLGNRSAWVKVDVEGAERRVLEGATNALSSKRIRGMQLEWNRAADVFYAESRQLVLDIIAQHGYRLYEAQANGTMRPIETPKPDSELFALPS